MRRNAGRSALTVVVLGLWPTAAFAIPGDPPMVPLSPANGAVLATSDREIQLRFTCPSYQTEPGSYPTTGFALFHRVSVGRPSDLRADGTLPPPVNDSGARFEYVDRDDDGTCISRISSSTGTQPNSRTPGEVVWQPYRECRACPEGYEGSAPSRFTLRVPEPPRPSFGIKPRGRAYGGFAVELDVLARGAPNNTLLTLERRVGKRWRTVPVLNEAERDMSTFDGKGNAIVKLPAGKQRLRLRTTITGFPFTSSVTTLQVRKPRGFVTSARDDGRYGKKGSNITFRVTGGGRLIREFKATMFKFCIDGVSSEVQPLYFKRVPIAPDGSILAVVKFRDKGEADPDPVQILRGKLRGRKLRGAFAESYFDLGCAGSTIPLAAKRLGR